jgi:hypothetical protein
MKGDIEPPRSEAVVFPRVHAEGLCVSEILEEFRIYSEAYNDVQYIFCAIYTAMLQLSTVAAVLYVNEGTF